MKQDTTAQRTPRYLGLVVAVMLAVGAVDQLVKQLILNWLEPGVPQPVIGDWFRFYLLFNSGAAFSMGENLTWLFTAIQLAFVLGALWFGPRMTTKWEALGLALVAGGALGNLIDRLFRAPGFWFGHVVDYISVGNFAVFNLADASITVGVVVFILGTLAAEMKGGNHGR
ncbi:signal peptidase II [Corynebacterium lehmanniae]